MELISVKDRLPDEDCFVFAKIYERGEHTLYFSKKHGFLGDFFHDLNPDDCISKIGDMVNVTHWILLDDVLKIIELFEHTVKQPKYYLKAFWQKNWEEVTKEHYKEAENKSLGSNCYWGERCFGGSIIRGKTE